MAEYDRVALVTGGGSGIGAGIVRELAARRVAVVICDIDVDRAEVLRDQINADGGFAAAAEVDVTSRDRFERAFAYADNMFGPVDILVNNAGVGQNGSIRSLSDETWRKTVAVNLDSVFIGSQLAASIMVSRRSGTIVNIASRAWLGWYGQFAYAATKGGVVSATRTLAIELAKYGVTVNCIAPGLIDTPLLRTLDEPIKQKLLAAQPTGTVGGPEDVAWAAGFLTSRAGRSVTGQVLYVCGGKSLYAQPAS